MMQSLNIKLYIGFVFKSFVHFILIEYYHKYAICCFFLKKNTNVPTNRLLWCLTYSHIHVKVFSLRYNTLFLRNDTLSKRNHSIENNAIAFENPVSASPLHLSYRICQTHIMFIRSDRIVVDRSNPVDPRYVTDNWVLVRITSSILQF